MTFLGCLRALACVATTALAAAAPASAAILVTDWKAAGDGLLLWDTDTNLQWLKLAQTQGQSYNQVLAQLPTTYAGFAYATTDDIWTFFGDAGLSPFYPAPAAAASSLSTLWGITYPNGHTAFGITSSDNTFAPGNKLVAGVGWANQDGSVWYANATATNALPGSSEGFIGSALFRPYQALAVPESGTPVLFLAGLVGLTVIVRRRRAS